MWKASVHIEKEGNLGRWNAMFLKGFSAHKFILEEKGRKGAWKTHNSSVYSSKRNNKDRWKIKWANFALSFFKLLSKWADEPGPSSRAHSLAVWLRHIVQCLNMLLRMQASDEHYLATVLPGSCSSQFVITNIKKCVILNNMKLKYEKRIARLKRLIICEKE